MVASDQVTTATGHYKLGRSALTAGQLRRRAAAGRVCGQFTRRSDRRTCWRPVTARTRLRRPCTPPSDVTVHRSPPARSGALSRGRLPRLGRGGQRSRCGRNRGGAGKGQFLGGAQSKDLDPASASLRSPGRQRHRREFDAADCQRLPAGRQHDGRTTVRMRNWVLARWWFSWSRGCSRGSTVIRCSCCSHSRSA
jgi:hypothetical protein